MNNDDFEFHVEGIFTRNDILTILASKMKNVI